MKRIKRLLEDLSRTEIFSWTFKKLFLVKRKLSPANNQIQPSVAIQNPHQVINCKSFTISGNLWKFWNHQVFCQVGAISYLLPIQPIAGIQYQEIVWTLSFWQNVWLWTTDDGFCKKNSVIAIFYTMYTFMYLGNVYKVYIYAILHIHAILSIFRIKKLCMFVQLQQCLWQSMYKSMLCFRPRCNCCNVFVKVYNYHCRSLEFQTSCWSSRLLRIQR